MLALDLVIKLTLSKEDKQLPFTVWSAIKKHCDKKHLRFPWPDHEGGNVDHPEHGQLPFDFLKFTNKTRGAPGLIADYSAVTNTYYDLDDLLNAFFPPRGRRKIEWPGPSGPKTPFAFISEPSLFFSALRYSAPQSPALVTFQVLSTSLI